MVLDVIKTTYNIVKNLSNDSTIPKYETLDISEEFETRYYHKNRFVVYKYKTIDSRNPEKNASGDESVMKNVWRLMKYTQSENNKNLNMKLHMPMFVLIDTLSSLGDENEDDIDVEVEVKMMISLPEEFQGEDSEVPKPLDSELSIELIEGFRCYVRRFSGFANESMFKKETKILRKSLSDSKIKVNNNKVICIAYDMPYKALNRRNEVIVIAG